MKVSPAGVRLSIWMAMFTFLTTAIIGLRIWAIYLTRRSFQVHDYLVSTCTMTGLNYWAIANGLGDHTVNLSKDELIVQFKACQPYPSCIQIFLF
ncbi:uncharacterized protein N7483_008343 [Penicillium malachiteum]|uniref:uncharacterized protein n=1 Tax=Penicillium malachiteum TaxID=1324776 RepID=UPI002547BB47|nr:uncharacterized protein N7483_008343 [Penicillium malachiteum]KAJ5720409.1 hypothetical protein N7483_008343 [Penicillium malachiteum]